MKYSVIFTCEHAGNHVPEQYQSLFAGQSEILESHRGWDPGAWPLAGFLAENMEAPLFGCQTTRLLIEANRSPDNPQLFSEFSSHLPIETKEKLIQDIYKPYREQVQRVIEKMTKPVLHLSIHSFTPIWNELERKVDIGILFDPLQDLERVFSQQLKENLHSNLPGLQICYNEPYQGTDDGFTTWLKTKYEKSEYTGIEIEVNQKFSSNLSRIKTGLAHSIKESIKGHTN
jgi:predicted N-formylglutamate amidohydrolase